MKVKMEFGFRGLSGSRDNTTFYYHPRLRASIARKKPDMPHQAINDTYRSIATNLSDIQPSQYYKSDFKNYTATLRDTDENFRIVCWYNLFTKMMWAMQKKFPETVDLRTITREQIYEQNLPCRTVRDAIDAGLLPMVSGYNIYSSEI